MDYVFNRHLFSLKYESIGGLIWILPLLIALFTYYRERSEVQKAVIHFVAGSFLLEYISTNRDLTEAISNTNNAPIYHIGVPILFWLMSRIYLKAFNQWLSRRLYLIILSGFIGFVTVNAIWGDGFTNFPSLAIGVYSLFGILLPIMYMLGILRSLEVPRLDQDPLFITAAGMLIYFSGNFLLWLFFSYIDFDYIFFLSIYRVNTVLAILLNLFLIGAILVRTKPKKINTKQQSS